MKTFESEHLASTNCPSTRGCLSSLSRPEWTFVVVLLLACLAYHAWLIESRWINADEGAHLMDASLVLDGLVPGIDFLARQPLYVYSYVPSFGLLEPSLIAGRLVPLSFTWLNVLVIFLLGRRIAGSECGAISALLFITAPIILVNAPVVKTEPLAMLLVSLGVYALLRCDDTGEPRWLWLSGALFGAGFYVRESSLAGIFAGSCAIAFTSPSFGAAIKRLCYFGIGMGSATLAVFAFYLPHMTLAEMLTNGGLFPPYRIFVAARDLFDTAENTQAGAGPALLASVRDSSQTLSETKRILIQCAKMSVHIMVCGIAAAIFLVWRHFRCRLSHTRPPGDLRKASIVLAWLLGIASLYAYYAAKRGFFQFYARELVPASSLLCGWFLLSVWRASGTRTSAIAGLSLMIGLTALLFTAEASVDGLGVIGGTACLAFVAWHLAVVAGFKTISRRRVFIATSAILVIVVAVLRRVWSGGGGLQAAPYFAFATIALLVLLWFCTQFRSLSATGQSWLVLPLASSVLIIGPTSSAQFKPSFDCNWPISTLRQVAASIEFHAAPSDTVMSGAVIWEFEAHRRPFGNVSHPLAFRERVDPGSTEQLTAEFFRNPPKIVILDGVTEETHFRAIPLLERSLQTDYVFSTEVHGGTHPVRVLVRRPSGHAQ